MSRTPQLTNEDIAFILETRTQMMSEKNVVRNFWWAMGEIFGIERERLYSQVQYALDNGMRKEGK